MYAKLILWKNAIEKKTYSRLRMYVVNGNSVHSQMLPKILLFIHALYLFSFIITKNNLDQNIYQVVSY